MVDLMMEPIKEDGTGGGGRGGDIFLRLEERNNTRTIDVKTNRRRRARTPMRVHGPQSSERERRQQITNMHAGSVSVELKTLP